MRISQAALAALPAHVARPGYDRASVSPSVVHFGPGAFHRAHQAVAFDTLLHEDPRWGINGVSLNSAGVADALNPQDGLYTLAILDTEISYRVIGSIRQILLASQRESVMGLLAAPSTQIISLTVTEKGYCLTEGGELHTAHPAIVHDLGQPNAPKSAIGWLAAGLARRRREGASGVTILSCDNLSGNGTKLGQAVRDFARETDPETARWIEQQVRFPNAMVDAITPATDDALRARVSKAIGLEDAWPIQREHFSQWVIEDDFAGERPALEVAGVTFTNDVSGFERAKLRLLNGAHSTLAYVGLHLGHETVAEAMRDSRLAAFVAAMMRQDIAPTLTATPGLDLDDYITAVLSRFTNPNIEHRLSQIAWDGSKKLPYRILDTVRDALSLGRPIGRLAMPIAAWLLFIEGTARTGAQIVDPLSNELLRCGGDWRAILAKREVFQDLSGNGQFREAVEEARAALVANTWSPA